MATRETASPENGFEFDSSSDSSSGDSHDGRISRGRPASRSFLQDNTSKELNQTTHILSAQTTPEYAESPPAITQSTSFITSQNIAPHALESRSNSGIKDDIWLLHADEMVSLSQKTRPVMHSSDSYHQLVKKIITHYLYFVRVTWVRCAWSLLVLPGSESS